MVGGWRLWILFVQGILLLAIDWRGLAQGPDCWETCFEPANRNDQYKNEYRDIMDMISNIRSAALTSGGTGTGASNGTAFLMDTTVPASASSEMQRMVLDLQREMAQILSFAMANTMSMNPLFFIKFDGTKSWYCYEWACLGRCDAYAMLENEMGNFTAATNKKDYDMVDDSCKMAANVMDIDDDNLEADSHIACHRFTFNEMVVAMVNSPMQTSHSAGCKTQDSAEQDTINALDGRGGFEEFMDGGAMDSYGDWCEQKFAKRAVVGMMNADEDEMESFATVNNGKWGGSSMMKESEDMLSACDAISTCMNTQCCSGFVPTPPSGSDTCIEFKDNSLTPVL